MGDVTVAPPVPDGDVLRAVDGSHEEALIALDLLLLAAGGVVLILSLLAGLIVNRVWISEAAICLLLGAAIGPGLSALARDQLLGPDQYATLEEVARITLGIAVMGVALRLPHDFVRRHWRDLAVALIVGLPLMWLASAGLTVLVLGVPWLVALLIGAIVAPTDPVVSQSIVSGRVADEKVPDRVRHRLMAESGANDGLGLPFVMLPILLMQHPPGEALRDWIVHTVLWEIGSAVVVGVVAGWIAGRLFVWAKRQPFSEDQSMLTIGLALSLTLLAAVGLLGGDGILAVFAGGLLFGRGISSIKTSQQHLHGAITRFFDLPVFVLIGVLLPWGAWVTLGWRAPVLAVALLALRRLPWWLLLGSLFRGLQSRQEILFAGWFGPIGVAAAFYAAMAHKQTGLALLWPVASLAITASVLAHGITATPLAKALGNAEEGGFGK